MCPYDVPLTLRSETQLTYNQVPRTFVTKNISNRGEPNMSYTMVWVLPCFWHMEGLDQSLYQDNVFYQDHVLIGP